MRLSSNSICAFVTLALASSAAIAAPTVAVSPTSITTHHVGTVRIDVGNVLGSHVILRLFVDANGNGVIDPATDSIVWTDVVADNVADWSPNMFSDTDPAIGAITVDPRLFGPLQFPYSAGDFVWQVEDSPGGLMDTVAFSITQTAQTQSVSGTARNASTSFGVPGALVILLPYCEDGDESVRLYSAFADHNGAYTIQVPSMIACRNRVVIAVKPGFLTPFSGQPDLVFDGSSQFTGQDPEITPGSRVADGRLEYSTGPQAGSGIPGILVTAVSDDGLPILAVGFTDENGDYSLLLEDGAWSLETPEDGIDIQGAVYFGDDLPVDISGGPSTLPLLTLPAANAYFEGTVRDASSVALAGREIAGDQIGGCEPDCYFSLTYSRSDGTYSVGVVAPASPATYEYSLAIDSPLPGLIGEQLNCELISENDTLTGRDLDHLAPTSFISGTAMDTNGQPLPSSCLTARSFPGCTGYVSAAIAGCDGTYSLPVIDGQWHTEMYVEDIATLYGGLAPGGIFRSVDVAGSDVTGVDFLVGPWRVIPHIVEIQPADPIAGSHMVLVGHGFSFGSTPQVFFDALPATVIGVAANRGAMVVEVPPSLAAATYDVTVLNTDTGVTGDPACVDIGSGPYVPVCTISGTATDGSGAVAGAIVIAGPDGEFSRVAVTDAGGNYSLDLDTLGNYDLDLLAPQGSGLTDGFHVVACDSTQDHFFNSGWELTGQVVDGGFNGVDGMPVDAEEVGGSGYFTDVITDEDGFFTLVVPTGNFDVSFGSPANSRALPAPGFQGLVSADTDVGSILTSTGDLFAGSVVDEAGDGVGVEVSAFRKSDGTPVANAYSDTCSGRFDFAAPSEEYGLEFQTPTGTDLAPARVEWIPLDGDHSASFDFVMFDPAVLPPATNAPRIVYAEPLFRGQQGQPIQLLSANLAGSVVDVLFSDGGGGFVNGTSTLVQAERGFLLTRIPAGAASGEMKLRVDGLESPAVPFTLLPGLFPIGSFTAGGTISGTGAGGSLVAVVSLDPAALCTDEEETLFDYGIADGSGNYGPLSQPGGDVGLFFAPPVGTTLVGAKSLRSGVAWNLIVNPTLAPGVPLSIRVTDESLNPIENASFWYDGDDDISGERLTDANGDATLYVARGDRSFGVVPPAGSRLVDIEGAQEITGPLDLGDQSLPTGRMVGSAVFRQSDGSPVSGAAVEGTHTTDPWEFAHETFSGADGGFHGPVAADTPFRIEGEVFDDLLADFAIESDPSGFSTDGILYPPAEVGPAGFVAGLVRDATSLAPLDNIFVSSHAEDPQNPGFLGPQSGFTGSCSDGNYQMKLAAGDHFVAFSDFDQQLYAEQWYSGAPCFDDKITLNVTSANTTILNADLVRTGTISGIVMDNGSPVANATICATSATIGTCQYCTSPTDASGLYTLAVPPATDYIVSVFTPALGTQCFDGFDGCAGSTPVNADSALDTPGIDFNFNCGGIDVDGDGVTPCQLDCDDGDSDTYPGAPEINDGLDNQCPGDPGAGLIDEISGPTVFTAGNQICWPVQPGATGYEVARSTVADFSGSCTIVPTAIECFAVPEVPVHLVPYHYLVRSTGPAVGSWGDDFFGVERNSVCP